MGVIGLILDVHSLVNSLQQEQQREEARKQARKFVKETAHEFCCALLEDSSGPMAYLQEQHSNLQNQLKLWQPEGESFREQKNSYSLRKTKYESLKKAAVKHLGN